MAVNLICSMVGCCVAETVSIPFDTAKVAKQMAEAGSPIQKQSMVKVLRVMQANQGFFSPFAGLSPALVR